MLCTGQAEPFPGLRCVRRWCRRDDFHFPLGQANGRFNLRPCRVRGELKRCDCLDWQRVTLRRKKISPGANTTMAPTMGTGEGAPAKAWRAQQAYGYYRYGQIDGPRFRHGKGWVNGQLCFCCQSSLMDSIGKYEKALTCLNELGAQRVSSNTETVFSCSSLQP